MRKSPTHYDTLHVSRDATPRVITAAWRTLSQEYHPDKSKDPKAPEKQQALNVAYEVLIDPVRRREYDEWLDQNEAEEAPGRAESNGPVFDPGSMEVFCLGEECKEPRVHAGSFPTVTTLHPRRMQFAGIATLEGMNRYRFRCPACTRMRVFTAAGLEITQFEGLAQIAGFAVPFLKEYARRQSDPAEIAAREERERQSRRFWIRVGIGFACFVVVLFILSLLAPSR